MSDSVGYENVKCHFNFPGCHKDHAGFERAEDSSPRGPFFDACQNCVMKPYPQPKQFRDIREAGDEQNS